MIPPHPQAPALNFYPRPPRGGRQPGCRPRCRFSKISIHALREEGDESQHHTVAFPLDFYPRPPRGGRRAVNALLSPFKPISIHALREEGDHTTTKQEDKNHISIHALREEGDAPSGRNTPDTPNFYPRPPRGGRLEGAVHGIKTKDFYPRPPRGGRRVSGLVGASPTYFYPRPPRGGRQLARRLQGVQQGFLSTPSARRATGDVDRVEATIDISIHALREEGDDLPCSRYLEIQDFYPRPPRGGRRAALI